MSLVPGFKSRPGGGYNYLGVSMFLPRAHARIDTERNKPLHIISNSTFINHSISDSKT
jgi:hypothetical protein